MTQPAQEKSLPPFAGALGRLPSGLFVLTASRDGQATGMLASWVQQAGFEPPMLTVAVRLDRPICGWVEEVGRFALSQVAAGQKHLIRHFSRGFAPDEAAFEGIELVDDAAGGPVLAEALSYLDAEVAGFVDGGDHRVYLARISGGAVLNADAEPMVHVRRNGLHY